MEQIVIDTNLIISSIISPNGKPAMIMKLFFTAEIWTFYCPLILDEYKRVLSYDKFSFAEHTKSGILNAIEKLGIRIEPPKSDIPFTHEPDRIFYDTAKASGSILITGNLKHYPTEPFIMTPSAFLNIVIGTMG